MDDHIFGRLGIGLVHLWLVSNKTVMDVSALLSALFLHFVSSYHSFLQYRSGLLLTLAAAAR